MCFSYLRPFYRSALPLPLPTLSLAVADPDVVWLWNSYD